jgi:hypothetical protein
MPESKRLPKLLSCRSIQPSRSPWQKQQQQTAGRGGVMASFYGEMEVGSDCLQNGTFLGVPLDDLRISHRSSASKTPERLVGGLF